MYYVYVLRHKDTSWRRCYVGFARNPLVRIRRHITGRGAKATQKYGVEDIVGIRGFRTERDAKSCENYLRRKQGERPSWQPGEDNCSYITVDALKELSLLADIERVEDSEAGYMAYIRNILKRAGDL